MVLVTRIRITPISDDSGYAAVHAVLRIAPVFPLRPGRTVFDDTQLHVYDPGYPAFIDIAPPRIDNAWDLELAVGANRTYRTVTFAGLALDWDALTDIDPDTLEPVPVGPEFAAWEAVRQQIHDDTAAQIAAHAKSAAPHRAYDDIPDLTLLFENKVITGEIIDLDSSIPDLSTVFDNA